MLILEITSVPGGHLTTAAFGIIVGLAIGLCSTVAVRLGTRLGLAMIKGPVDVEERKHWLKTVRVAKYVAVAAGWCFGAICAVIIGLA